MTTKLSRVGGPPNRKCNRGSVLINTAIAMSLIVLSLIGTELGYLFFMKREIQKAADLAALAGAQKISSAGGCANATTAAKLSANGTGPTDSKRNLPSIFTLVDGDIECGQWSPDKNTADHFEPAMTDLNAIRVTIKRPPAALLPFFEADRTIQSKAVATNDAIASFSLGTGVASLDEGLVNALLGELLGSKSKISLTLVDYKGLANAQIHLLDLISVVPNVGTVDQLLKAPIKLNSLMLAMVQVLSKSNTLAAEALNSIVSTSVRSADLTLGDLIKVTTPYKDGAATASVSAFDLLMVAAQVANGRNAVNLGASLDLGALAKVDTKLVIVEPPSIAIGAAGKDSNDKWKTQAHSATIRLFLDAQIIDTTKIPLIGGLAGIQLLHLPLYIEAAPGDAWLSKIQCNVPRANSVVTIGSRPGLASVCIADSMNSQMDNTSVPTSCTEPATVSKVSILPILGGGLKILDVQATVPLTAMIPVQNAPDLLFDGVIGNTDDIQRTNSNAAGSVLSTAVGSLASGLKLKACLLGFLCLDQSILAGLLQTLNTTLLTPLLGLLDTIIQPLLGLLGVQVGYSDIHHQSLTCGEARLVY